LMAESGATVVTAAEAEASKKNIADFLLRHSVYELLPESGKVVALDVTLPVKQAFHALYEQVLSILTVLFHFTRLLHCAPTVVLKN
jgi:hypothetical protein